MKAVVNFGHGPKNVGFDPGAVGSDGYQEATVTRNVGSKVVTKLKANGWNVLAIQDGDLPDVTNQANAFKPDYFVSIHADSFATPDAHGITTFALSPGGKGQNIAQAIQNDLVAATGLTDRGVKFEGLWVLRKTDCPAVLVEIGFISNPAEEALMKQDAWDDKVANAIAKGFSRAVGAAYSGSIPAAVVAPVPVTSIKKEDDFVLETAIVVYGPDDLVSARRVAVVKGGCAIFIRSADGKAPLDVFKAKQLIIIGGATVGHPNEVLVTGDSWFNTVASVNKFLGGK